MMNAPHRRPLHARSRLAFYALTCLIAQVAAIAILVVRHYILGEQNSPALGLDFPVYWAAARVAMTHGATAVYSPTFMTPLEISVRPYLGYTPWPYPPMFLLFVFPFGLLPFGMALVSFLGVTAAAYARSIHAIARPLEIPAWLYALAFPAVFMVTAFGQNSLLTVAIAGAALHFLPKRPVLAGAFIALLSIKPQLAILFPLLLICGRQWRAFASAAAFTLLLTAISVFAFGTDTITAFLHAISEFNHEWIEKNALRMWEALTSVYGTARVWGASSAWAYAIHAAATLPSIAAIVWLWVIPARYELRAAALAVGVMLLSPYIVFYDLAWLALPIAFLAVDMKRHGASRGEIAILVVAWLMPVQALVARWFPYIGQWTPAVLLVLIGLITRRHLRAPRAMSGAQQLQASPRVE